MKEKTVLEKINDIIENNNFKTGFPELYEKMSEKLKMLKKTLSEEERKAIDISSEVIDNFEKEVVNGYTLINKSEDEWRKDVIGFYHNVDGILIQRLEDRKKIRNKEIVAYIENSSYEIISLSKAKKIKIGLIIIFAVAAVAAALAIIGSLRDYIPLDKNFLKISDEIGSALGSLDFIVGLGFGLHEYFDDIKKRTEVRVAAQKDILNNTDKNSIEIINKLPTFFISGSKLKNIENSFNSYNCSSTIELRKSKIKNVKNSFNTYKSSSKKEDEEQRK